MIRFILSILPRILTNNVVVIFFEVFRIFQKVFGRKYPYNRHLNDNNMESHEGVIQKNRGFIEDQDSYADMVYGKSTMKYAGCEIIAVYNAIIGLGKGEAPDLAISLPQFIGDFEKDGMVFGGKFGTAPKAMRDYLEKHGQKTIFTTKKAEFDEIGHKARALILTMYNNGHNLGEQVHTICITKENDMFSAHNTYCNGRVIGPFSSVSELIDNINDGKAKGISLIGIM